MGRTPKAGPPDEKITINLGPVDLGMVDLLVEEGYFASRTDLIRSAIRRLIDDRQQAIDAAATRREVTVGFVRHDRASLELVRRKKERLDVKVVGVFELADDVEPDLADATIERLWVLGSLKASPAVLARLSPKIARGKGKQHEHPSRSRVQGQEARCESHRAVDRCAEVLRAVRGSVARMITVGYQRFSIEDVALLRREATTVRITVVGWLRFDHDISAALVDAVFERVRVIGLHTPATHQRG